jgi:aryl-alcohol dehydrogenase-like predicted oxidoreductase
VNLSKKVKYWVGQSQATVNEIRKAHAVTPLTAIQSEFSIMERMYVEKMLFNARNSVLVPFSPLASGFFIWKIKFRS